MCNTTSLRAVHHQSQQHCQVFVNHDQEDCLLWFYSEEGTCKCLAFYGARCFDNKAYLSAGFCATLDTNTDFDSDILSLGECPSYYGFTYTKQGRFWFIQLPDNVSELNDYMCGPLNRKIRLCSECMQGCMGMDLAPLQLVFSILNVLALDMGYHYFYFLKCSHSLCSIL